MPAGRELRSLITHLHGQSDSRDLQLQCYVVKNRILGDLLASLSKIASPRFSEKSHLRRIRKTERQLISTSWLPHALMFMHIHMHKSTHVHTHIHAYTFKSFG